MRESSFPRLDALPGSAAIGCLATPEFRSNRFHMPPVRALEASLPAMWALAAGERRC